MHAVCETSQCLDVTCPVGMAVVSTRIQEQCCPSQTCGKPTNSITMWLRTICISVFFACLCLWNAAKETQCVCLWKKLKLLSLLECACEKILRPKCSLVSEYVQMTIYLLIFIILLYVCDQFDWLVHIWYQVYCVVGGEYAVRQSISVRSGKPMCLQKICVWWEHVSV